MESAPGGAGRTLVTIRPETARRRLLIIAVVLGVASYTMHLVSRWRDWETIAALDVGDEVSVATLFETLLFLVCGLLTLALARVTPGKLSSRIRLLGIVLVALSIDESVSLHERLGSALRDVLDTGGILYYIWVVPAVAFALAVAVWEIAWLRSLPMNIRRSVVAAGILFVLSAGGLELLAGPGDEDEGSSTMTSISLTAVEELGEMVGLALYIGAILQLLVGSTIGVRVAGESTHATPTAG